MPEPKVEDAKTDAPAKPEGEPQGVTMDTLYPPKSGEKPDADKGGEPAKKPEEKPEAKPDKKPETPAEPPAWDKERQKRDQEHANERRAFMGQMEAMQRTNEALVARLEEMATPPKPVEKDEGLEDMLGQVDGLGEDADPAQLLSATKLLSKALRRVLSRPHSAAEVKELREQLAAQDKRIEAMQAETETREEEKTSYEGRKSRLTAKLLELDGKHGVAVRNEAIKRAREILVEQGYTAEHEADEFAEHLLLERCYAEAAAEQAGKPKPKPKVGDDGVGGAGPAAAPKRGSRREVLAMMEKEGKLK